MKKGCGQLVMTGYHNEQEVCGRYYGPEMRLCSKCRRKNLYLIKIGAMLKFPTKEQRSFNRLEKINVKIDKLRAEGNRLIESEMERLGIDSFQEYSKNFLKFFGREE